MSRDSHLLRHHTPKHSRIHSGVNGGPDQPRANQRPKVRDFASLEQLAAMRVSVSSIRYFLKKVAATTAKRRRKGVHPGLEHVRNPCSVTAAGGSRWLQALSHWLPPAASTKTRQRIQTCSSNDEALASKSSGEFDSWYNHSTLRSHYKPIHRDSLALTSIAFTYLPHSAFSLDVLKELSPCASLYYVFLD